MYLQKQITSRLEDLQDYVLHHPMTETELNQMIGFSRKIEKYMTNDILKKFDGGEIELMFTKNYGEDEEKDD